MRITYAAVKKPVFDILKMDLTGGSQTFVLCDGVQNPGNLGAILRTAAAFDVNAVLLYGESVDPFNPKVVRASSGAVVEIPVFSVDLDTIDLLKIKGFKLLISSPSSKNGANSSMLGSLGAQPSILAFGSEGRGISQDIKDIADGSFFISTSEKVESLNVTAAAAIALYAAREKKGDI